MFYSGKFSGIVARNGKTGVDRPYAIKGTNVIRFATRAELDAYHALPADATDAQRAAAAPSAKVIESAEKTGVTLRKETVDAWTASIRAQAEAAKVPASVIAAGIFASGIVEFPDTEEDGDVTESEGFLALFGALPTETVPAKK